MEETTLCNRIKWIGKGQPIAFINECLYFYNNGWVCKYLDGNKTKLQRLQRSLSEVFKELFGLTSRFFRTEVKATCVVAPYVFFFKGKKLFVFNASDNSISKIYSVPSDKSTPLNLLPINDDRFFLIFGDYFSNPKHEKVRINGLTKDFEIVELCSFPQNTVRHIHNIISKPSGYYILTGDNEQKAGIYSCDLNFNNLVEVYTGKPNCRSVCGFSVSHGLVFATDLVEEANGLFILDDSQPRKIMDLNGSVIYGAPTDRHFYLSTTVESSENSDVGFLKRYFSTKKARGILSNDIFLQRINKGTLAVETLLVHKKDRLPYKLFQYGAFRIVGGFNRIAICPVATNKKNGIIGLIEE